MQYLLSKDEYDHLTLTKEERLAEIHATHILELRQTIAGLMILCDKYERWWKAVDELGVVVNWTPVELDDPNPYEALKRIIEFDVQVALDPAVSGDAMALYEEGRQDGLKECQQSHSK